jgi:hypothetical protein
MEPAGAPAGALDLGVRPSFEHNRLHPGQSQFGREHDPGRPGHGNDYIGVYRREPPTGIRRV